MSITKDSKFSKQKPQIPLPPKNTSMLPQAQSIQSIDNMKKEELLFSQNQNNIGILKWKIGKFLGGGNSGSVYKALNIHTGMLAAVKKIIYLEMDLKQSRNQLKILNTINHPNVVRYIEDYELKNQTWVFMELLPSTLYKFYKSFGFPPYNNFVIFAKQMIEGLNYLHKQKIVHKDLKCSNIMLDSNCTVKLADFGCSKGFEKTISLIAYEKSGQRSFKGSPFWLAPQAIKEARYTRKTDIWSLGCTLLELATGKYPWHDVECDNHIQMMIHIGMTDQLPTIPPHLHQNIRQLISNCLHRDPDKRMPADQLLKLKIFISQNQNKTF